MRFFHACSCLVSLGQEFQAARRRSANPCATTAPVCGTYSTLRVRPPTSENGTNAKCRLHRAMSATGGNPEVIYSGRVFRILTRLCENVLLSRRFHATKTQSGHGTFTAKFSKIGYRPLAI